MYDELARIAQSEFGDIIKGIDVCDLPQAWSLREVFRKPCLDSTEEAWLWSLRRRH